VKLERLGAALKRGIFQTDANVAADCRMSQELRADPAPTEQNLAPGDRPE